MCSLNQSSRAWLRVDRSRLDQDLSNDIPKIRVFCCKPLKINTQIIVFKNNSVMSQTGQLEAMAAMAPWIVPFGVWAALSLSEPTVDQYKEE